MSEWQIPQVGGDDRLGVAALSVGAGLPLDVFPLLQNGRSSSALRRPLLAGRPCGHERADRERAEGAVDRRLAASVDPSGRLQVWA